MQKLYASLVFSINSNLKYPQLILLLKVPLFLDQVSKIIYFYPCYLYMQALLNYPKHSK